MIFLFIEIQRLFEMFQQLLCVHTGFFAFFMWVLFKEIQKAVYYALRSFLQGLDVALLTFKWPGWVKKR